MVKLSHYGSLIAYVIHILYFSDIGDSSSLCVVTLLHQTITDRSFNFIMIVKLILSDH